jgi:predicted PurR-regulated permease PerM
MELTISNRTIIRIVAIVVGAVIVIRLAEILRTEIIWMLTALFLALALEPAVKTLSRFMPRKSRGLSVLVVLLLVIAILVFILVALIPPFASQGYRLASNLPSAYTQFLTQNPGISSFISSNVNSSNASQAIHQFSNQLLSFGGSFVVVLRTFFGGAIALSAILVLTFFMVLEGPRWIAAFWRYSPEKTRASYQDLVSQMFGTVTGYVNGRLLTGLIAGLLTIGALLIIKAPFAIALGLSVGLLDLIPMIGALLGAILLLFAVLVFKSVTAALIMAVYLVLYQQVENHILQPIIFSKTIEVSPLVTLIAVIFGVSLAGFLGALVAIPVAASIQILVRHYLSLHSQNSADNGRASTAHSHAKS